MFAAILANAQTAAPATRPNILWLTAEDICPNLGCYGDKYAVTPNLDRFATQAVRYTQAFGITGVACLTACRSWAFRPLLSRWRPWENLGWCCSAV